MVQPQPLRQGSRTDGGPGGDTRELGGRVALITGAAGGIGLAIAGLLSHRGAAVTLFDADPVGLGAAATSLRRSGADVIQVTGSVSSSADCRRAVSETLDVWKRLDFLVNSAGIGGGNFDVATLPEESWRNVLEVNATGTFLACKAVLPTMLAAGFGRIVNIASIAGLEGNPRAAHYSASKAAVIALTKSLAKETAVSGILVNAIAPAVIDTDLLKQVSAEQIAYMLAKIPMQRFGTPDEVAALVGFLVGPDLTFSTGAVYDLSGGRATY